MLAVVAMSWGEKFKELTSFSSEPNKRNQPILKSSYDPGLSYIRENEAIDKE